jgi:hypothetical protein
MKKKKKEELAETHPDLKGLNIRVNEFGEITTNISLEKINDFLDKNVVDKKLNEDEWEVKKKKSGEKKKGESNIKGKKAKR